MTAFRMGSLQISLDFLDNIPRPAMLAAIRAHFSGKAVNCGDALRSEHSHDGIGFLVETLPARDMTRIQLCDMTRIQLS